MLPFDPRQMAMNLISQNPNIANNPNAQEFIKVIQNGDSERGQQIANNLCQSYGMTRDEALKSAKSFFNLPF